MTDLDDIKQRFSKLSPGELAQFRAWFDEELDDLLWDRQIEADSLAGRLDRLAAKALAEHRAGKTREI
ncbi:MAG: hypothetical protein ACT4P3_09560 [Betaproteobacteria bacterium]